MNQTTWKILFHTALLALALSGSPIRAQDAIDEPATNSTSKSVSSQPAATTVEVLADDTSRDKLSAGIAEHEERARQLAEQIRQHGKLDDKHPDQIKSRKELEQTLTMALDLKFQQEQLQLKELEDRLSRMRMQFQLRKKASRKIVERRLLELIKSNELDWNSGATTIVPEMASIVETTPMPVAKRVSDFDLDQKVRTLEPAYFAERKPEVVAELKEALQTIADRSKLTGARLLPPLKELPPNYQPEIGLAWLESELGGKLEFVKLDDLNIQYPTALRIKESGKFLGSGQLIVGLNGYHFESIEQAVAALLYSKQPSYYVQHMSGLERVRYDLNSVGSTLGLNPFIPVDKGESAIQVEIQLQVAGTDVAETKYLYGTCITPDGLAVIPVLLNLLKADSPIIVFGRYKGTAQVVASDDQAGLTLLKLQIPGRSIFSWSTPRTIPPARQQRLERDDPYHLGSRPPESRGYIVRTGEPLPAPSQLKDGFIVEFNEKQKSDLTGRSVFSLDGELQGMICTKGKDEKQNEGSEHVYRHLAIPATYIQNLLDRYRGTASSPDPKPKPSKTEVLQVIANPPVAEPAELEVSLSPSTSLLDVAQRLTSAERIVGVATERLKQAEAALSDSSGSAKSVAAARSDLEAALRRRKLVRDNYTTTLRDLELQIESADVEVKATQEKWTRAEQLFRQKVVSDIEEKQARWDKQQAEITLKRLKLRYESYQKADQQIPPIGTDEKTLPDGK